MTILIQIGIVLLLLECVFGLILFALECIKDINQMNKQNEYYRKHNMPMLVTLE